MGCTKKKKKPRIILQLDITAPPEELAKSGECYATLRREIELPFVPFIGLRLVLDPQVTDEQENRYSELSRFANSHSSRFDIEHINYYIDQTEFILSARNRFEPTLEQFHALQEFLITFYGFYAFPSRRFAGLDGVVA